MDEQGSPQMASSQVGYGAPVGYPEAPPSVALPPADSEIPGRLLRLLLRRVAYGVLLVGRVLRPHLGWVLLTLLLVGIIGMESAALVAPLIIRNATNGDQRVAAIATSTSVEDFLRGQARYDADMMWDAFSPSFQEFLATKGISKDDLAAQAQSERDGGQRYTKYAYVGGVRLPDSNKMYFYAVDIVSSQADRNGTFSFVFTVDGAGKIVGLRM
jgi:hypothetical protein